MTQFKNAISEPANFRLSARLMKASEVAASNESGSISIAWHQLETWSREVMILEERLKAIENEVVKLTMYKPVQNDQA